MDAEQALKLVLTGFVVVAVGFLLVQIGLVPTPWGEDRATVRITDGEGTTKAEVDAAVADTWLERHSGLSDHDSLDHGEGMLFVHAYERERTYVMRDMTFAIDIVFVGSDGEITTIHHARAPEPGEDGTDLRYSGRAKWVLEVPRGYTNETGIEVGDEVVISDE